jgi:sodium/potassium-transporting ATPase subunit alpha
MSIHNNNSNNNSNNNNEMSIHNNNNNNNNNNMEDAKQILFIKGAPDVLLLKCNRYLDTLGQIQIIDENFQTIYTNAYEDFGGQGERVLGFAMRYMDNTLEKELLLNPKYKEKLKDDLIGKPEKTSTPINDLIFVGLVTLQDPPRVEVPQAIKECHNAGVKVVMVYFVYFLYYNNNKLY